MQKVVKRDFTTAFMVLELTWGSLDRNSKACSSRGLHSSGYPVETRICHAWQFARVDVWRWSKSWRGIWHIDSNNYEWRLEQIPIQRKTKLEISVARLRLLSCFVGFSGSWSWSSLGDLIKPVDYGGRINEMTRFALFMTYCRLLLTWQQSC